MKEGNESEKEIREGNEREREIREENEREKGKLSDFSPFNNI